MTSYPRTALVVGLVAGSAIAAVTGNRQAVARPPPPTAPAEKRVDPEADRLLRQMTDYLAGLSSFQVMSSSADEVVTKDGRKIDITADSQVSVARPNQIRSEEIGVPHALAFWDDGKTMTLYCKGNNTFATVPAPPSLDATFDTLRKSYKIDAPGADLLYSKPYDVLTEQVTGGMVIGKETVDGVLANHLAFQGEEVDWQVWIQDGAQPLPLRYEITTKTMAHEPEFTVRLSHWQPQPQLAASTFQFEPPAGAKQVAAFPTSCGAPH
jgi:hypothetical protein